jgi:hypothetical protein
MGGKTWRYKHHLSFPKTASGADSRHEPESAHHSTRCLRSSVCSWRLLLICSGRGASLKSKTCFFGINSILPCDVHRAVCGCVVATGRCWSG